MEFRKDCSGFWAIGRLTGSWEPGEAIPQLPNISKPLGFFLIQMWTISPPTRGLLQPVRVTMPGKGILALMPFPLSAAGQRDFYLLNGLDVSVYVTLIVVFTSTGAPFSRKGL